MVQENRFDELRPGAMSNVHIHLHVSNLEASRAFYERFLGAEPVKVKPGYVKFLPALAAINLALVESTDQPLKTLDAELGRLVADELRKHEGQARPSSSRSLVQQIQAYWQWQQEIK